MRKRIIKPVQRQDMAIDHAWLDVEALAEVEITSEDAGYPIENALLPNQVAGWRASAPGEQTLRLRFTQPQRLHRIWLRFVEDHVERTQEFLLRWSSEEGQTCHEIVRQQWNFNPHDATAEIEDYHVDLQGVRVLELIIVPDIGGKTAMASLQEMRLA
jgi:hypothetical protein